MEANEEQKNQLLEKNNDSGALGEDDQNDLLPPSSRVKKILKWNTKLEVFEMEEQHQQELRAIIKDDAQWAEFEKFFTSLRPEDHPSKRKPSICTGILLASFFFVILLAFLYVFFIILQLALFNLIMLVVMAVWWWKLFKICQAITKRILDNGRKAAFKSHIRKMKELEWLKNLSLEIQEQEEGKWIEVHLNETVDDDKDDLIESADEDEK